MTINGSVVNLGQATTVTANTTAILTLGTGLTGTSFNGSTNVTANIANTTVTAGTYGNASTVAQVIINAQGQVTNAVNVAINIANSAITGLGTMATQNANLVTITGGQINVTTVNHTANTASNVTYTSATMQLIPAGYINFDLNGVLVKIPYYNA